MKHQVEERRGDQSRRNSPTGWVIGGIFVVAVVAIVFFYTGRDAGNQTTTSNPNDVPSVTTGSNNPAAPNR